MRPSKRQRIARSHLASSERGARLLAAAGGDAEHADRIDRVLDDLRAHSKAPRSAEVVQLPRRPYDYACEVDESAGLAELELEPHWIKPAAAWLVAGALGVASWLVLAAIAFGLYELASAL